MKVNPSDEALLAKSAPLEVSVWGQASARHSAGYCLKSGSSAFNLPNPLDRVPTVPVEALVMFPPKWRMRPDRVGA